MSKNIYIQRKTSKKWENIQRGWYSFSRNRLSVIGLIVILLIIFIAIFAPYISPSPESAGLYINFSGANQPPSLSNLCGTDVIGRDVLSRIFFGFRMSLFIVITVLALVAPFGVVMGITAGYFYNNLIGIIIMRITDMFLAIPPLLLALVVCSILNPNIVNAMIAISIGWWPWYCRLIYGYTISIKGEDYVRSAEVIGASNIHILFKEILRNCLPPILTKMSLDAGVVILIASMISFVGLGAQPPTPDLGSMVADGCKYLPELWWISVFPAFGILITALSFNLIGDGIGKIFMKVKG